MEPTTEPARPCCGCRHSMCSGYAFWCRKEGSDCTRGGVPKQQGCREAEDVPPLVKLCRVRKNHRCRICSTIIRKGELCERWTGVEQGEGWWTSHAHPECYDQTVTDRWDYDDWESGFSDMERPAEKRKCFVCQKEAPAWIAVTPRPRHVCSAACYDNYVNARDMT